MRFRRRSPISSSPRYAKRWKTSSRRQTTPRAHILSVKFERQPSHLQRWPPAIQSRMVCDQYQSHKAVHEAADSGAARADPPKEDASGRWVSLFRAREAHEANPSLTAPPSRYPALTVSRIRNVENMGQGLVEPFQFSGGSHCYRERAKGDFQCIARIEARD